MNGDACQHRPLYDDVVYEDAVKQVRETKCRLCGVEVVYTCGEPGRYTPSRVESR